MSSRSDQDVSTAEMTALERLPMPPTYFRIVLRELGTTARRRARLLVGTGVTEAQLAEPAAEITLGAQTALMRNAARLGDPGWSLDVARRFDLGAQGPLGFAMVSAPTLGIALDVMTRYGHVRAPWFRLRVERDRSQWAFTVRRQVRFGAAMDVPMIEAVLLSAQVLIEAVLGRPMLDARIAVDYPPPPWAVRYEDVFNAPVIFDAHEVRVRMPSEWLALACPLADAAMHQLALGRLETERRRLLSGEHLSARIEVLLAASGDAGLSLQQLADRLNMSRRTLIRRLAETGTCFGHELDHHRMRRSTALLEDGRYPISEIAYRLGYSEPANFTRAFRRWFGETPQRYRERRLVARDAR